MKTRNDTYRRIVRRESHSPRSALAITLAVVLIALCALLATEAVLRLIDRPALLAAPVEVVAAIAGGVSDAASDAAADAPTDAAAEVASAIPAATLITVGVIAALVGLALVIAAIAPGRRAKHHFFTERSAVVVDDEVIASALARFAAHAGNLGPDNASVTVSRRLAEVRVRPASGFAVDSAAVQQASDAALARIDVRPPLTAKVAVAASGAVGS